MSKLFKFRILFILVFIAKPGCLLAQGLSQSPEIKIAPDHVSINAFYKGSDVMVSADIPSVCDGAVVKIQGEDEKTILNRKGKVSIFWLNVGEVTFTNAPVIYILNASNPLDSICASEEQKRLMLGYAALKERIIIDCETALSGTEFDEFVRLKEHNGSYQNSLTAELLPALDRNTRFTSVLHIPPVMPSGNYQIKFYYFKNFALTGQTSAVLSIEKVGIPNFLYSLAYSHPAAYGLLAIVIAMATGIIMGMIFSSRPRRKS